MNNHNGRIGRLRIRNFHMQIDPRVVNNLWTNVHTALGQILQKNNSGLSFEELYRNAYNLVLQRQGDLLYHGFRSTVESHLQNRVQVEVVGALQKDDFLQIVISNWNDHQTAMVMIRDILMYMDRVYVTQNQLEPIYNLGLMFFRDQIVRHEHIRDNIRNSLLSEIAKERSGQRIDCTQIRQITKMLMLLGINTRDVYEQDFERAFLIDSREFYQLESEEFLQINSASAYIHKVENRIEEEISRAKNYLDISTEDNIVHVVEEELITNHLKTIVEMPNSGVVFLIRSGKHDELNRMYKLFRRVPNGLTTLFDCISKHLREEGKTLVDDHMEKDKAIAFVKNLLELRSKYVRFLERSFENSSEFSTIIDNDFCHFINLNSKAAEFLSLFIDDKMKPTKQQGNVSDEDAIEQILEKAMVLFKFLNNKDVFEKYYKHHTAKRLIQNKSLSTEMERFMINKLRVECGTELTNKLEGMFKDMHVSNSIQEEFLTYLDNKNIQLDFSLQVRVLTMTNWPHNNNLGSVVLPELAARNFEHFKEFYIDKNNTRKLTMWHSVGTVEMTGIFQRSSAQSGSSSSSNTTDSKLPGLSSTQAEKSSDKPKQYHITVSTFQMCILMLFNRFERLSFDDIRNETQIPEADLVRALQPIAVGKPAHRLLVREAKTKGTVIDSSCEFIINERFKSAHTKVKIPQLASKSENEKERQQTLSKVNEDRRHAIEACIVRVMKARKRLDTQSILLEVSTQLASRFIASSNDIKSRLVALIDREYLTYNEQDKIYTYIS